MGKMISVIKVFDGSEDVGSTNAVSKGYSTTKMIELNAVNALGLFYQAVNAAGTTAFKIEMITHYSDTIASAVEPESTNDIDGSVTDTDLHHTSFTPPPTPYLAITVTGTGSNDADARMTVWLVMQEEL